jgi:hypothetical protein
MAPGATSAGPGSVAGEALDEKPTLEVLRASALWPSDGTPPADVIAAELGRLGGKARAAKNERPHCSSMLRIDFDPNG